MNKYLEISSTLLKRIEIGFYDNTSNPIPNELELAKEFNCSRMTLRKAIDILVKEGLIYRRRGAGSFIRESVCNEKFSFDNTELKGLTKSINTNIKNTVLSFKIMFPEENIAKALSITKDTPVYEIIRIRYINDYPYVIEKTYMNANLITGINEEVLKESIYDYIENKLNLKIDGSKKILRADISNDLDKKYLLLKDIEPVLEIEQIAYLNNGAPFEYSFSRHRYDKFEFTSFTTKN